MKDKHKNKKSIFNLMVQYLEKHSSIKGLALSEQARTVTDWRRERKWEMNSWRIISNRRWRASCSFTHAWHWWVGCWLLAEVNSIYPFEKMIRWYLGSTVPDKSPLMFHSLLDILGSKWRICTAVLHATLYSNVYKSTTTCRECMRVTMYARHMN